MYICEMFYASPHFSNGLCLEKYEDVSSRHRFAFGDRTFPSVFGVHFSPVAFDSLGVMENINTITRMLFARHNTKNSVRHKVEELTTAIELKFIVWHPRCPKSNTKRNFSSFDQKFLSYGLSQEPLLRSVGNFS